jgi:GT2 family glycosyltransferase/glycosyltransferase involved in cell wall biosynthesis
VVLVNFRGTDDTIEAIRHLREVDWPADDLEIVVVENGSGDDSLARLRAEAPGIVLVESNENLGFAGGCNLGVARSTGEYLAFLNNDARPDSAWIRAAVSAFSESESIGAVASRVLDWEGTLVDYTGSAMTWFGQGYKPSTAEPYVPLGDVRRDVLFGTGSAMFVRRSVFEALGGFDERYFMFFEDVDLGWRLNLRGWRFVYEPASLAFHKHHASMTSFGAHKEHYLLERNALFTLYKNASTDTLRDALPAAMGLAVRRGISRAGADSESFDLRRGAGDSDVVEIGAEAVAPLYAIDRFVEELPGLVGDRDAIQASRTVSDAAIWRLFGLADAPILTERSYVTGYENLTMAFDVTETPRGRRVLVITGDPIGAKLAGPAIRAWNMAEALAVDNEVTLVTLSGTDRDDAPFRIVHVMAGDDRRFKPLEQWADVIVFQGDAMAVFDDLRTTSKIVVADVYDPMHLEQLEQARGLAAPDWARAVSDATGVLNDQLERADFLIAASERQRHFYLGQMSALGRLSTANYDGDPDLRGLIDVVPFGLPVTPPEHRNAVLKGVWPGIGDGDTVLLWSGGLYNWFDPETLIVAVAALSERRSGVRLFFQGTRHPHPGVPEMAVVARSRALAAELGVLGVNVFFNDSWVDYDDRQNFLLEASAGVSTHFEHIETTFSFRTRILDYLWASLPMVVTAGDHFAELVEREELGVVVPASDPVALAAALEKVLFDQEFRARAITNIARVREGYRWDRVLEPLVRFVANAHPAADRVLGGASGGTRRRKRVRRSGIGHDVRRTLHYLRNGGPALVLRKVRNRIGRR